MTAAEPVCTSCGAKPSRLGARYCDACGCALPREDSHAEFKQVTVLFADVVGSMEIAAAVGPERLREIMAELVGRGTTVARRYGGTMIEFTGDGLMAVFGAPMALEDHAVRACLAALDIQKETSLLAAEARDRDGISLQLRVGLNSGQVIGGEIGSGVSGYRTVGEHVGKAQRMESVAPPGGVVLSASTARLVEHAAVLAEAEQVRVKGADEPVWVCRLLAVQPRRAWSRRTGSSLVGRHVEMANIEALVDRAANFGGGVAAIVGSPGVGKSRLAREAAELSARRDIDVEWAFCESHSRGIPFQAIAQLLRAATGIADLDSSAARVELRARVPAPDPEDLLLLDDLLGIAEPDSPPPKIDPDARRRRLTALIHAALSARIRTAMFVVEDVHWIDEVSDSMLADVLTVIPRIPSVVLITYRPEYLGALTHVSEVDTIAIGPLDNSDTSLMINDLLGSDPSVSTLAEAIAARAAGNPFFVEEMVRELLQRGVLAGSDGAYVCSTDAAEVSVPATVQAAIEARIDRLTPRAKRTLNAASVIGARFEAQLLTALGIDSEFDELLGEKVIDQVSVSPQAEYAFHDPLIRAVAYESQLTSDRARLHRRLAAAIQSGSPQTADQNAALIAEHLEAAGELHDAFAWHMRAGAWSTNRDIAAASHSWERARRIADALPPDDAGRTAMRIAPLTMLCGTAWRVYANTAGRFDELRELCALTGDKPSLAIGMAGIVTEHLFSGRVREASRLASEQMALLESIGDPALTIGAGFMAILVKYHVGEIADVLRWSQDVIDWADGDAAKGNVIVGSPLALALVWRGVARFWLGRDGWHQDLDDAVAIARSTDPATSAWVVIWKNQVAIGSGVLLADDSAVRELDEALQVAERSGDDTALGLVKYGLGVVLVGAAKDRPRGVDLLRQVRNMCLNQQFYKSELPVLDFWAALEMARCGERDAAIPLIREAVQQVFDEGRGLTYGVVGTAGLVEMLLNRGADGDAAEAQNAFDRLAALPAAEEFALCEITLLRLRALLARARGDDDTYHDLAHQYREMAESLGFEGHLAIAKAMVA